ncbi:Proteasomal ubiquitin receptor ADRM1 [Liparis tanakae]|uniref:Oxysterol-binding protein n=1 Tax=Liparis tanakae TaxID=230148 RepID=A0A4Z2I6C5_9TELE|nr:Proteasomal ubiquitin receptor ADRM1 [Liparis tanakae]
MNSEEEFYDAETGLESDDSCEVSFKDAVVFDGKRETDGSTQENGVWERRKTLPAEMISRHNFSVWSILKKCIGMELSKIAMPVVFNEPLSFLQRISEYMEHTHLIHKACSLSDSIDRMQVVAAFAVSAVASQWERTGKPFNPLLGETYELTREDEGYRLISEQVSHHPPVSAFHAQSLKQEFAFHGTIYPKLKFWGKSMEAEPKGVMTLELLKTGDKCVLNFKPCGMFGKELHKVEGHIQDKSKKKRRVIYGKWTECMYSMDPKVYEAHKKSDKKTGADSKKLKPGHSCEAEEADEMPEVQETVTAIPGSALLWRILPRPADSPQMYNFTSFAMTLNELEPGMERLLPPTDCRLRPDIRAMEKGDMGGFSWEQTLTLELRIGCTRLVDFPLNSKHFARRHPEVRLRSDGSSDLAPFAFFSLSSSSSVLFIMASGALFPSMASGSRGSSSKYLVEFRAGKMTMKGSTVTPDKRKGQVYIQQTDDSLIHFCWKDRTTGNVDDDLIIFPDDCEFKRVSQCTTGRVYVLKFKAGSKRLFFWIQEPKTDKDEEHCRKVNEYLNNPPMPGALGSGGSGGHDLSALGGEGGLQSLLGNMSHNQLMQLIGPTGLGGIGGLGALAGPGLANLLGGGGGSSSSSSSSVPAASNSSTSPSTAVTPTSTSTSATSRLGSTPVPTTPITPSATSAASPTATTPSTPVVSSVAAAGATSPAQPIQLRDLQSILATMNVPASGQGVDLASVLTPEIMAPILVNPEVQERLTPYLPSGESLPQSTEELHNTLSSPQFQQAMSMFSSALASGQLGPLMNQFGLPAEAVDAANKGDVEAFAKAMETKSDQDGDSKEKKDDDEDMSLD